MLAEAFADNPLNRVVVGGDRARRLRSNRAGMQALLPTALRVGTLWTTAAGQAALIAAPPYAYPFPAPGMLAELRTLLVQGARVRHRWGQAFEALDRLHPLEPHWYLATLGVHPDARGRGHGRALLEAFCAGADRDRVPAYLETDREENLGLYERAGFSVRERSRFLDVPLWHLYREASAHAADLA